MSSPLVLTAGSGGAALDPSANKCTFSHGGSYSRRFFSGGVACTGALAVVRPQGLAVLEFAIAVRPFLHNSETGPS